MRVRLALHEKQLSFVTKEEDLKNFSQELLRLHPEKKVPLLIHGDAIVYESAVITEYLEDAFPSTLPLMPTLAHERAQVRLWTHWCNHTFKPHIDHYKYGEVRSTKNDVDHAPGRLLQDLAKLESALKTSEWLVGQTMTLADIHVFPFYRQLVKTNPALPGLGSHYQANRWYEKIGSRPAFEKTMQTR